jgi:glycosyltransferase involved in cell wall biosynthesis
VLRFRFQAPFIMRTGYGKLGCWLAKCFLERNDIQVDVAAHQGKIADDVPPIVSTAARDLHESRRLGLLLSYADHVNLLPTEIKTIYTMWETTRLPSSFVQRMKRADLMFAPSEFCASLFRADVKGLRVEMVGCGVDTDFYSMGKGNDGPLTMGISGVMSPRKGIDVLLNAWRALAEKKDVCLLVKTRDTRWLPKTIPANVIIIDEDYSEEQMREFYRSLDYYVFPSRGEGFGLGPIEAACCGVPGYATNWSGMRDYIGDHIKPIEWDRLSHPPTTAFARPQEGKWAEPSVEHLASLLIEMYNAGRPTLKRRKAVSSWARGNYSIRRVADRIVAELRGLHP